MQGHLIAVVSGYTFEASVFGADRVRYDVEEVEVFGSSWEVVVHGDGSCTRVLVFMVLGVLSALTVTKWNAVVVVLGEST